MNEKMLYQAFDLQRFVGNERLQKVINRSHARVQARELSDSELEFVSAAGITEPQVKPEEIK
ncbi:MAG: hypothetical protein IKR93_05195 [Firmicutes bacterium]|nr:hypothetical protein [Bacillota bacterium]